MSAAAPGALSIVGFHVPVGAQGCFLFSNEGQTQDQQDFDEFQCIRESLEKTGFDPMATPQATERRPQQRERIMRAFTACMTARGDTVG